MFEQRRKVEEEYASAAYSQLLTFVELFEFYIGCQQPDLVVPLRIDDLPDVLMAISTDEYPSEYFPDDFL